MPRAVTFIHHRRRQALTGGHIYDDALYNAIALATPDRAAKASLAYGAPCATRLQKLLAPIRNIGLLRTLGDSDTIIVNSSAFGYLLPLSILLRLAGKELWVIHHLDLYRQLHGLRRFIYRIGERLQLRTATTVLTPSPYLMTMMPKRLRERTVLIPMPITRHAKDFIPDPKPGRLIYTSTIEPRKGLHILIDAMGNVAARTDCRLDVYGKVVDRKYMACIEKRTRLLNLEKRIFFHGHKNREELEEARRYADILVFPSSEEGFGMAMAEAMVCGVPVIAFDTSAMPYLVKDGKNGLLVPLCANETESARNLAAAIMRLSADRELRRRLGAEAIRTVNALTVSPSEFPRALLDRLPL